jgi:hypothetical protein
MSSAQFASNLLFFPNLKLIDRHLAQVQLGANAGSLVCLRYEHASCQRRRKGTILGGKIGWSSADGFFFGYLSCVSFALVRLMLFERPFQSILGALVVGLAAGPTIVHPRHWITHS